MHCYCLLLQKMKYLKSYFVISLLRMSIHVHIGKFVKLVIKPFGIRKIDLEESFRGVFNNICKNLKVLRFCCFPTGHRTFRRRPGHFWSPTQNVVLIFILIFPWRLVSERNQQEQQGIGWKKELLLISHCQV